MLKFIILGLFVTVLLVRNSESAPKYQFLEKKDGYVPVYIRVGDQPLANINPELAEAFHEPLSISGRNIKDSEDMMMLGDQPHHSSESASSEEKEKEKEKKKNLKKKTSSESNESGFSSEEIVHSHTHH